MNLIRRDLQRGELVTIHDAHGRTSKGRLDRVSRRYFTIVAHKVEANGVLVECSSDRMLVPRAGAIIEASRP